MTIALYTTPLGFSFLFFRFLLTRDSSREILTVAILSHGVLGTEKLRKTCADTIEQSSAFLWSSKNDIPLSVSMCKPRTGAGGHRSKYWPSVKLLGLVYRLEPDIYHTLNHVGYFICHIFFFFLFICLFAAIITSPFSTFQSHRLSRAALLIYVSCYFTGNITYYAISHIRTVTLLNNGRKLNS